MNLISYWIQLNRRNTTIINLVIYEHEFFFCTKIFQDSQIILYQSTKLI